MGMTAWEPRSGRSVMGEGIDAPRGFGADALDLHQIGQRGSFDRFQRAEMQKQRAFAGRSDARNFLQTGFAEIAFAAGPVRAYGKKKGPVAPGRAGKKNTSTLGRA